ncbi:MAG: AAA family ATPase, partial [Planctomycetes bacterium]|nr:AAA family ATPase [Planctomycetota bacterium]
AAPPAEPVAPAAAEGETAGQGGAQALPGAAHRELEEVRVLLAHLRSQWSMPAYREEVLLVYCQLLDSGLAQGITREICDRLHARAEANGFKGAQELRAAARALLAERLPTAGPIAVTPGRPRMVALVGPTGVGKTTTIAKLAGNFVLKEGRQVELATLDNFRIAASDQLRKMAELMEIRLHVIDPEKDPPAVLKALKRKDVVLLDTAGRSPNDQERLDELLPFLEAARPDEVHLVLSATTHPDNLIDMAHKFALCRFTRVILTKLDEAARLGPVVDVLARMRVPISYVTTGQGIPRDIEVADAARLAALILPEKPREASPAKAERRASGAAGATGAAGRKDPLSRK